MTAIYRSRLREKTGFTLVEVMVALGILAFGILAVGSMQVSSLQGTAAAGDVTEATLVAGNQLDQLMAASFTDPLLVDTDSDGEAGLRDATAGTADQPPVNVTVGGKTYTVFWNTAQNVGVNNTVTIGITVVWTDRGMQKSLYIRHVKPSVAS
jgi:prepilin-type N-terminal cleavage/methylation domain-containing protein